MAKIDKIKEKISLYKFFLGIITGMILSIIGFIFANYQSFNIYFYITLKFNHKKYWWIGEFMKEILIDIVGILLIVFVIEILINIKKLSKND